MRAWIATILLCFLSEGGALADDRTSARDMLSKLHESLIDDIIIYGWKIGAISLGFAVLNAIIFEFKRKARKKYYNEDYLQSDAWKRKRAMVLRRDGWKCVFCGAKATDVHHKRYARQIGREPIDSLVSVCPRCHAAEHPEKQAA